MYMYPAREALGRSRRSIGVVLGLNRVVCGADWLSGFARDRVRTLNRETRLHALGRENTAGGFAEFLASIAAMPCRFARLRTV